MKWYTVEVLRYKDGEDQIKHFSKTYKRLSSVELLVSKFAKHAKSEYPKVNYDIRVYENSGGSRVLLNQYVY